VFSKSAIGHIQYDDHKHQWIGTLPLGSAGSLAGVGGVCVNFVGKIVDITGGANGLATIHFADGSRVLVESGFGLRQFTSAFGGSLRNALGRIIAYDTDFGMLATAFEIVDEEVSR
jgi:hypothetical protein